MQKTNQLLNTALYQAYLKKIEEDEKNRLFCKHDLKHFLDVARIATIKSQEAGLFLSRDLIYCTALLHDIGRSIQETPHEIASYDLAQVFLEAIDFSAEEKQIILQAIKNHRNPKAQGFNAIFFESDKLSRQCFACAAQKNCHWSNEKKNLKIHY